MSPGKRIEIEPLERVAVRTVTFVITECQNFADPINASGSRIISILQMRKIEAENGEAIRDICVSSLSRIKCPFW